MQVPRELIHDVSCRMQRNNSFCEALSLAKMMANYLCDYQKKIRIFSKRRRTFLGALSRGEPQSRLVVLAEKLRHAKLQVFQSRQIVSQDGMEQWQSMSSEEIINRYRKPQGS